MSKMLIMIKALQSKMINVNEILKTDIEASNKGIFALSSSGNLVIIVWVRKKVLLKQIEDVSDALWQKKGSSELIAACHSGAIFRYTISDDIGLTKSLQLSAKSLLTILSSKDSSITSVKSLRIWGHSSSYILLQPQPDRLVLLSTNSKARPEVLGTIKTASLRSAYLTPTKIFVQPFTGSDIYIHDVVTCKTIEVVSLLVSRPGVSYIQWDSLICNFTASQIAITDCERRIYVAKLENRTNHGKKSGVIRSKLIPHQVVWPASFKPVSMSNFLVFLSEEYLSVFCSATEKNKEQSYYLTHNLEQGGSLSIQHVFTQNATIIPGLPQDLPDLFLCDDGVFMLTDKDCAVTGSKTELDFDSTLATLKDALESQDIDQIYKIKTAVEEDLSLFLSTCNHKENWTGLVEIRSNQHAALVDVLLSFLTKSASSVSNKTTVLGLKELVKHHIMTLLTEMSNVLLYVDAEKVSQLLLQMIEQMNFYAHSVDNLKLPEGKEDDKILLAKFEIWADKPVKTILLDALQTKCVQISENYLKLKPWIYGPINSDYIVTECIDIARQNINSNLLLSMGQHYERELKSCLYSSKDFIEIRLLEAVLNVWKYLSVKDILALTIIKYIHRFSPLMILRPPKFWLELLKVGSSKSTCLNRELTIGMTVECSSESLNLVLLDVYARANDHDIIQTIDMSHLWKYLLIREEEYYLSRWIFVQLEPERLSTLTKSRDISKNSETPTISIDQPKKESKRVSNKPFFKKQTLKKPALSGTIYGSDSESLYSIDSTIWEGIDESIRDTSEVSYESLNNYRVSDWSDSLFSFINQSMIDDIASSTNDILANQLLVLLASYGLFQSSDKNDPQTMVRKILTSAVDLKFRPIGDDYQHKVNKSELDALILDRLADRDLSSPFFNYILTQGIDDVTMYSKYDKSWIKLVRPFRNLSENQAKETIYDVCLETLSYMVANNEHMIDDFFSVLLSMLYAPNATLSDFINASHQHFNISTLSDAKVHDITRLSDILSKQHMTPLSVLEKLAYGEYPFLQSIIKEPVNLDQPDISIYDLLRGSVPFDISTLFTWQKDNKHGYNSQASQPSLDDETLIKNEGVKCSLDYYYYLKAGRPTYALASIILSTGTREGDPVSRLKEMERPVYGLALSSWPDKRICSACIALLFIASLDFEPLRTLLYTADMIISVLESIVFSNFPENLKKSQLKLLKNEVRDILCQLCTLSTRKNAAIKLISLLEDTMIAKVIGRTIDMNEIPYQIKPDIFVTDIDVQSEENIYHLLETLKLANEIASIYEVGSPAMGILEFLAQTNQWLLFLAAIEIFQYPPDIVMSISKKFKSEALQEHFRYSLINISSLSCSSNSDVKNNESPSGDLNCTSDEISALNGIKEVADSSIVTSTSLVTPITDDNDSITFTAQEFEVTDLFSLIISIHEKEDPGIKFLEACLAYRHPIFGVIAACYDRTKRYHSLTAWLYAYLPDKILQDLNNGQIFFIRRTLGKPFVPLSLNELLNEKKMLNNLKDLFTLLFDLECIDVLQEGIKIFDQNSPALFILEALEQAKNGASQINVNESLRRASSFSSKSNDLYTPEEEFTSRFCMFITCRGLDLFLKNKYLQQVFLTALLPYGKNYPFSCKAVNWDLLKEVVSILGNTRTPFNIFAMISESIDFSFESFVPELINYLIEMGEYEKSLRLAELFSLGFFDILCSQLKSEFVSMNKRPLKEEDLKSFLQSAHLKTTRSTVHPDEVCHLFQSMSKVTNNFLFKYYVLQYAVLWGHMRKCELKIARSLNNSKDTNSEWQLWCQELEDLELQMWISYLESIFEGNSTILSCHFIPLFGCWPWELEGTKSLDYSMLREASTLDYKVREGSSDRRSIQDVFIAKGISKSALEILVNNIIKECLSIDAVVTACRISNSFNVQNKSINAMLSLMSKACEGSYISDGDVKSPMMSRKTSNSSQFSMLELSSPCSALTGLWLTTIEKLYIDVPSGNKTAKRTLTICRVVDALNLNYLHVIHNDDIPKLFTDILCERSSNGIQLVRDLIGGLLTSEEVVNKLLLDEVVAVISAGYKKSFPVASKHFLSWEILDDKWVDLLSLSDDPSVLGYMLLDVFQSTCKESHPDHVAKGQMMSVELIVRAHDCFSEAANMEGINAILQASPELTKSLLKHKQWALMGRLLTGIRRYNEMSYLIDLLRENQQFERLLQKNSDQKLQSSGLDKALVHFLHSNYPADKEMLRMVALHFLMFSELATMWADEGEEIIKIILDKFLYIKPTEAVDVPRMQRPGMFSRRPPVQLHLSLVNSQRIRTDSSGSEGNNEVEIDFLKGADVKQLSEAMQCFYYASQYCAQEKQLVTAMRHSRRAELIALQVSLVKSAGTSGLALRILNLPPAVLRLIMTQHLSVREIIVISRSYGALPDWGSSLYFHFIKNGFRKFLLDFLQFYDMSTDTVLSIVKKIEKAGLENEHKERMCLILTYVQEVDVVYMIASQLDIRRMVEECLEPPYACYLKDTVFCRGISS